MATGKYFHNARVAKAAEAAAFEDRVAQLVDKTTNRQIGKIKARRTKAENKRLQELGTKKGYAGGGPLSPEEYQIVQQYSPTGFELPNFIPYTQESVPPADPNMFYNSSNYTTPSTPETMSQYDIRNNIRGASGFKRQDYVPPTVESRPIRQV